jgi:hypothetical protein
LAYVFVGFSVSLRYDTATLRWDFTHRCHDNIQGTYESACVRPIHNHYYNNITITSVSVVAEVARLGGDEFVVMLEGLSNNERLLPLPN